MIFRRFSWNSVPVLSCFSYDRVTQARSVIFSHIRRSGFACLTVFWPLFSPSDLCFLFAEAICCRGLAAPGAETRRSAGPATWEPCSARRSLCSSSSDLLVSTGTWWSSPVPGISWEELGSGIFLILVYEFSVYCGINTLVNIKWYIFSWICIKISFFSWWAL